jgi:hypothetical protein
MSGSISSMQSRIGTVPTWAIEPVGPKGAAPWGIRSLYAFLNHRHCSRKGVNGHAQSDMAHASTVLLPGALNRSAALVTVVKSP